MLWLGFNHSEYNEVSKVKFSFSDAADTAKCKHTINGRCTILTDAGDYGNHYENRQFKVLPIGKDNFAELRDKIVIT